MQHSSTGDHTRFCRRHRALRVQVVRETSEAAAAAKRAKKNKQPVDFAPMSGTHVRNNRYGTDSSEDEGGRGGGGGDDAMDDGDDSSGGGGGGGGAPAEPWPAASGEPDR
jgi:hypothetical protein